MDVPNSTVSALSNKKISESILKGNTSGTSSSNNTLLIVSGVSLAIALGSLFYEKFPKKYKNYQYGVIVVLLVITFYLFLNKDKFSASGDTGSNTINEEVVLFNGSDTVLTLSNGTVLKKGEKWIGIPGPSFGIKEIVNKTIINDNLHMTMMIDNYSPTIVTPDKTSGTIDLYVLSIDSPAGRLLVGTDQDSNMKLIDPNADIDCSVEIKGMKWGTTACAPIDPNDYRAYLNLSEDLQSSETLNYSSLEFKFFKANKVYYSPNGQTGNVEFNEWPNGEGWNKYRAVSTGEVITTLSPKGGIMIEGPSFYKLYNIDVPIEERRADSTKFDKTITENYDREWAKKVTMKWNNKKGVFVKEVTNDTVKFKRIFGVFPIEIA